MRNKITTLLVCTTLVLSGIIFIPNAFAENVPNWVKNTAGWWATDAISETEFVNAVEFLVKENIIQVNVLQTSETSQGVPAWVKNTAGWWAADVISETEFVNAIAYLIKVGIISIESSKSPELSAEMWINGHITDDEFLTNIENLIETRNIIISDNSIVKTSQLPDWLVNNAGWWAARIITNSDFNFDPEYVKERIYPCKEDSSSDACQAVNPEYTRTYNSHGLRGDEFEKEKPDNIYRIFTVGGSTTFGTGVRDSETWPAHLQQIINEKITDKEIEVINAGQPGYFAAMEYNLIKNKLYTFEPDLIIMYDGFNDYVLHEPVDNTIQNWKLVCKLGKNEGFDTIIIVQPIPTISHRVLTEQEVEMASANLRNLPYLQKSQQYVDGFKELDKVCSKTANFTRIFDYIQEPIFYDEGHTLGFGNKIIAENIFSVISPIYFGETYSVIHNNLNTENNKSETSAVYAVGSNLSSRNFDNLNLQNAVFDRANLSNTSFKNANIDGARFAFANLSYANLSGQNLAEMIFIGADLSNANLTNTILTGADLSHANLSNVDFSGVNLAGMNLTGANLSGTDLSGKNLTGTLLTGADLSYSNLSGVNLAGMNLTGANLSGTDLSGKNLTGVKLDYTNLADANLENAKLFDASLVGVDFTKIKNKSLAGADLGNASLAESNLSGVNLTGVILLGTNFWKADLSGQDFTVISSSTGSVFTEANLSNSNFEDVGLAPESKYYIIFKNKAHLKNLSGADLLRNLLEKETISNIKILSKEVLGNDLALWYIFYNNFTHANLENANFKDAGLGHVNFYSANLTNANLSGADLGSAYLGDADLSNANLDGALLDEAILSCLNHSICKSG